jgi:hypothetical protein
MILPVLALLGVPVEATVSRSCRATGAFEFKFEEWEGDSYKGLRTKTVNVLESDMEVVAVGEASGIDAIWHAKLYACSRAAYCYMKQSKNQQCESDDDAEIITIKKPASFDTWRREVACGHARAGNVSDLEDTGRNAVIVKSTRVVATAKRDSVTESYETTLFEHAGGARWGGYHVCWQPEPAQPVIPSVPKPRPEPPRPAANDLAPRFQVVDAALEVNPSLSTGACPLPLELKATLTTVGGAGEVRFRLNHKGGRGPIRRVTFSEAGTKESNAVYRVGEPVGAAAGSGGGPSGQITAQPGAGGGGIGGFRQDDDPNHHTGYFELEIVSPRSPVKTSEPAHYKVVCKPQVAVEPVDAQFAGSGRSTSPAPASPPLRAASAASPKAAQGQAARKPAPPAAANRPTADPGGTARMWLVHLDRKLASPARVEVPADLVQRVDRDKGPGEARLCFAAASWRSVRSAVLPYLDPRQRQNIEIRLRSGDGKIIVLARSRIIEERGGTGGSRCLRVSFGSSRVL